MGDGDGWVGEWVTTDPFAGLQVPESLYASMERHRANLVDLVRNLQSAGIGEAQIEASVSVMVASYREELLRAIKLMMR
jgi:hypothetical protein